MKSDFLDSECTEKSQENTLFGICDGLNGRKAYTDERTQEKWIAIVKNPKQIKVTFTAIDNCRIYLDESNNKESTCDGVLTFSNHIYLVELKNKKVGGWLPEAKEQLLNTIKLLQANDKAFLENYKYKKAYACNKKHPHFTTIDNETSKKFYNESSGFRLDAQSEIKI